MFIHPFTDANHHTADVWHKRVPIVPWAVFHVIAYIDSFWAGRAYWREARSYKALAK